jgi:nitronate monooxygenase
MSISNKGILELLGIQFPIIQAPMAGADSPDLAAAVTASGGLGSLACALLSAEQTRDGVAAIRKQTSGSLNLNYFCHSMPTNATGFESEWKNLLRPHYERLGLDVESVQPGVLRMPFDAPAADLIEELAPQVVSFHFGLPETRYVARLKACGIRILSTATSTREALWLEAQGCDAVIAQGSEAGGHRGMFLEHDADAQIGTLALVAGVTAAVKIPVIAAGGIADARGIYAAFALGAGAVQLGTAYLFCPEANISPLYRAALARATDADTVLTNLFSGRPARGIANRFIRDCGPMAASAPPFPLAGHLVGPLKAASQRAGSEDYLQMWAGQGAGLCRSMPAGTLTQTLADEVRALR